MWRGQLSDVDGVGPLGRVVDDERLADTSGTAIADGSVDGGATSAGERLDVATPGQLLGDEQIRL